MTAAAPPRTVESLSERERKTVFVALLASITAVGFAIGGVMPLSSILLERRGVSAGLIGLSAALPVLAVVLVSIVLGPLSRALGITAVLIGGLLVSASATLLMAFWTTLPAWLLLRFLTGLGAGAHWILSETWLNAVAPDGKRGLYSGLYSALFATGFVIAPVALSFLDLASPLPFYLLVALMLLGALPLWLARRLLPDVTAHGEAPAWGMLRSAPLVFAAALAAGFNDAGLMSLLGVYTLRIGFGEGETFLLLAIFAAGSVALQIPLGLVADRGGHRSLLLVSAAAGALGAALLPFTAGSPTLLWPLLFVWGGLMVGLYTLGLAELGARFKGPPLAGANALYVSVYAIGSVTGPLIYGAGMDWLGPHALPVGVLVCCLMIFVAGLAPRR
jgi:MFS family permease